MLLLLFLPNLQMGAGGTPGAGNNGPIYVPLKGAS